MSGAVGPRGSVRRHVRIDCPPDQVWALIGDPARIQEWFPGIVSSSVSVDEDGDGGAVRTVTTAAGLPIPEQILTNDAIQRRFQYRITAPMFREHLSTLDVLDMGDGSSVVVYAADAVPATLALVIAGAAGNALLHLKGLMEGGASS